MTPEALHRAEEASRLLSEPLLAEAFEAVRLTALVALGDADPTDVDTIRKLQARAACLKDVLDHLEAAIRGADDSGISLT